MKTILALFHPDNKTFRNLTVMTLSLVVMNSYAIIYSKDTIYTSGYNSDTLLIVNNSNAVVTKQRQIRIAKLHCIHYIINSLLPASLPIPLVRRFLWYTDTLLS